MPSKMSFPSTSVITFITCERFNGIVYNHVVSQVPSCGEFFVAYLTGKRFLPRVFSCMNNQLSIRYSPPFTPITFEWPLVCVCHQMYSEMTTTCCSVVTLVTFVPLLPGMYTHVLCEVSFILCRISTFVTITLAFTSIVLDVTCYHGDARLSAVLFSGHC